VLVSATEYYQTFRFSDKNGSEPAVSATKTISLVLIRNIIIIIIIRIIRIIRIRIIIMIFITGTDKLQLQLQYT